MKRSFELARRMPHGETVLPYLLVALIVLMFVASPLADIGALNRAVLVGIRRAVGVAPDRKQPMTAERLTRLLDGLPNTLAGKRDRALLALGFAGAFRRSERIEAVRRIIDGSNGRHA